MTKEEVHATVENAVDHRIKDEKERKRKRETSEELNAFEELSISQSEGEVNDDKSAHSERATESTESTSSVSATAS